MIVIGERINSTRKSIAKAIEEKDVGFLQKEALKQVEAGADYVDVNAGIFIEKEAEYLEWLVQIVQEVTDKPLCIDSPNPQALASALRVCKGNPIINSITAQKEIYEPVLRLVKEYKCGVIALCQDDAGIPQTAEGKVEIASRLIEGLTGQGVSLEDIYVDILVQPIAVDSSSAMVVFDTIEQIGSKYPGVHTTCGLSNISFGLPGRSLINQTFLLMAMVKGLDSAILDPCDQRLMASILVANPLLDKDKYCMNYLKAFRAKKIVPGT